MQQYIKNHFARGDYRAQSGFGFIFENRAGWRDVLITQHLLYSHRDTDYTKQPGFAESHHFHEQFELQFYLNGDVDFVCDEKLFSPKPPVAIWFRPGEMHNTRLLTKGRFERVVFRFRPNAFTLEGKAYPLCAVFEDPTLRFCKIPPEKLHTFLCLFEKLDRAADSTCDERLAMFAYTVEVIRSLTDRLSQERPQDQQALPEKILAVKSYIDEHYASIGSVGEIAEHFFYSREHISRLFRRYCNTSVSEYLTRIRLRQSLALLDAGAGVTAACFSVGFGNMSSFIAAFKKNFGLLPSAYAKKGQTTAKHPTEDFLPQGY